MDCVNNIQICAGYACSEGMASGVMICIDLWDYGFYIREWRVAAVRELVRQCGALGADCYADDFDAILRQLIKEEA